MSKRKRIDLVFEDLFQMRNVLCNLYNEILPNSKVLKRELEEINKILENLKTLLNNCQDKINERLKEFM
jgi:uncharacterized protein with HEPN domain